MKKSSSLWLGVIGVIFWCCQVKAAVVQSGTCGGECTWRLDDQGVFSTVNGSTAIGEFNIPEGTKTIATYAFRGASGLSKITIPDSVTSIGSCAFRESGVTGNLKIPSGVTSIANEVFRAMGGVTGELKIPDGVTSIGNNAFDGMRGVTSLILPNSVTSIGSEAFLGMSGVTGELKIPDGVTSIGVSAFNGMSGVTSVTIPNSVTSIGGAAFAWMNSLSEVFLSADSSLTDQMLKSASINLSKIVRYTADGQYMKDGKVYASLEDYRAGTTFVYNEAKGKYQKMDRDGVLLDGYYNADGSKLKYRIYTVEEAEEALGKNNKNTFSIRYR